MTWVLILPYRKIPDGLSLNSRAHHMVKHRSTQEVRSDVVKLARSQRIPKLERIGVTLTWVVADRRNRDPDNMAGLWKAAVDGLASNKGTSARIVADDDPAHVHREHPRIEYEKGAVPHFRLEVIDLSHQFRASDIDALMKERDL